MKKLMLMMIVSLFAMVASAEFKAGVIDMQKAIQSTKAGKKAKDELEKEFEKKKVDLKKKEDDLKKRAEEFEKKKMVLADKSREEQQIALQQDMMKFREDLNKSQMMIQQKERELTKPILDKLQKAISDVAKEKDLSVVLEKTEQSVMWAKADMDITEEVIKKADK
ncbi:MAG: OmpH family outer membrane protein [Bdellovibrionaceae bacterium]|nr:OmpH family outer membrane protein [Pseudobdellovibrionaceae bacterium]